MSGLDTETQQALADVAAQYEAAPVQLRAAILAAARAGAKPSQITRAIGHVFTYEYVAKLIRDDRKSQAA